MQSPTPTLRFLQMSEACTSLAHIWLQLPVFTASCCPVLSYGCWLASAFDLGSIIECILFHGFLQRQKPIRGLIYVRLSWRFGELGGDLYYNSEWHSWCWQSPWLLFLFSVSLLSSCWEHTPYHCPPTSPIFSCRAFSFPPISPQ